MSSSFGILLGGLFGLVVAGYIAQSRLPPPKPKIIGIDLGTTYSCVGAYQAISCRIDIFSDENDDKVVPSLVAFTDKGVLVGEKALSQAEINPKNTIYDAKRFIGKTFTKQELLEIGKLYQFRVTTDKRGNAGFLVGKKGNFTVITPEEIGGYVIKKLRTMAERNLTTTVTKAVMSVPAEFDIKQRNATVKAASLAGITVLRVINEPTAAALAYGLHKKEGVANVMVVDLGGGTLDVSLLNIQGGMFVTMAMAGNNRLGGQDFNARFMQYLLQLIHKRFNRQLTCSEDIQRLRQEVEAAKINLTRTNEVTIKLMLPSLSEGKKIVKFKETISRKMFETINEDLFKKVLQPIRRVLAEVELPKEEVDEVVLVGGSTRVPKIRQLIQEFFDGKPPNVAIDPELAVATGVSIQAGIIGGMWPLQVSAIEINNQVKKIQVNE